jgi:hypothetical protein
MDYQYNGSVYPCEIYEVINAQIVTESSMVVLTRASTVHQNLICHAENFSCPRTYENDGSIRKFYIAQSEAFTILIDHAVTASAMCQQQQHQSRGRKSNYACSAESAKFSGRLFTDQPELCKKFHRSIYTNAWGNKTAKPNATTCYIEPNKTSTGQDFFSLDVLLQAAAVSLDDCDSQQENPCQTTYRDSGATLLLNIYWSDFSKYHGKVEPYYYYRANLVGGTYKQEIPFYETYRQRRTLLNAHGIKIAVLLGGDFHAFEPMAFLLTLTTALGLLAVVTTVLDSLMLYILPNRERYQQAKFELSEDILCDDNPLQMVDRGLNSALGNLGIRLLHGDENDENLDNMQGHFVPLPQIDEQGTTT